MQAAETELKFPVADVERFHDAAARAGFALHTRRTFEANTLYDTPDRTLRLRTELLRLRQYGEVWTLTHKCVPDGGGDDRRYKTRIETETRVEDGPALATVFSHLGFGPVFRYEKFRTEWEEEGGHLVLDETPIGIWAELEGPPAWIDAMLTRLGVDETSCTTESYGALFLAWKERTGGETNDLTFESIPQAVLV